MEIKYLNDSDLKVDEFLDLAQRVWPREYDRKGTEEALRRTINITARVGDRLVGSVRILTDGYFFGTIPEIMVDPEFQRQGIGKRLMKMACQSSPTGLFFGAQNGNEDFFEKIGFERSLTSFVWRKPRTINT